jgi:acyl-CoA thioester hydrolase
MPFRYVRRVQFADTDLAGIVHFSWLFKYMEEAEHAAWRAAGLSVAGKNSDLGWPRVAVSFEFHQPLHFEDEVEISVALADVGSRSLQYQHTVRRGDVLIGSGRMKTVCVKTTADGKMRAAEIPEEIVRKLRGVLADGPSSLKGQQETSET